MSKFDYDLFVIGAGSGGVRAARLAAAMGKKVAVAEEYRAGGTCVIRGCVPKKYLVYGAQYGKAVKDAAHYGWEIGAAPQFNWAALRDNIQNEVSRLSGIYENILAKNGADFYAARAVLTGPHSVELSNGQSFSSERILIAVGGTPFMPNIPGAEHAISSNEAFLLDTLPARITIIGGGFIACEFAGIFAGLGAEVTQIYRGDKLLRGFDDDIRVAVGEGQKRNGIDVRFGLSPTEIKKIGNGYKVKFDDGSERGTDLVMMATGRSPNITGLGLASAGVKVTERGAISVDAHSQTSQPSIYAVGDVTDRVQLTPVAIREAAAFIDTVYKDRPTAYDHSNIPAAVFTIPPVGTAGLTEIEARARYKTVEIHRTDFRPMKNILAQSEHRCVMKMITKGKKQKVVGVHIVGDDAPEMIQLAGVAVKAGLTKAQFDATCAVHPTIAEELVTL